MIGEQRDDEVMREGYAWEFVKGGHSAISVAYLDGEDFIQRYQIGVDTIMHTEVFMKEGVPHLRATWLLLKKPSNPVDIHHAILPLTSVSIAHSERVIATLLNHFLEIHHGKQRPSDNLPNAEGTERPDSEAKDAEQVATVSRIGPRGPVRSRKGVVVGEVHPSPDTRSSGSTEGTPDQVVEHAAGVQCDESERRTD